MVGTVKVKNLSFHKEVFIRSSWDGWKTKTDTFCTYSQIVGASGAYVIYDTFSFKLTLPPHSRNLEFCVCFKADDKEFWDSNGVSLQMRRWWPAVTNLFHFISRAWTTNYRIEGQLNNKRTSSLFDSTTPTLTKTNAQIMKTRVIQSTLKNPRLERGQNSARDSKNRCPIGKCHINLKMTVKFVRQT